MKLITERDLIRGVADAWGRQFISTSGEHNETKMRLVSLNKETATADEVNEIIGNASWTNIKCDQCGTLVKLVVQVGKVPAYESNTANLCTTCLTAAYALLPHNEE